MCVWGERAEFLQCVAQRKEETNYERIIHTHTHAHAHAHAHAHRRYLNIQLQCVPHIHSTHAPFYALVCARALSRSHCDRRVRFLHNVTQ